MYTSNFGRCCMEKKEPEQKSKKTKKKKKKSREKKSQRKKGKKKKRKKKKTLATRDHLIVHMHETSERDRNLLSVGFFSVDIVGSDPFTNFKRMCGITQNNMLPAMDPTVMRNYTWVIK